MEISIEKLRKHILGCGLIEEHAIIDCWRIRGFFKIGAYTHLCAGANLWNTIIGRYCRIDANVCVGFRLSEPKFFSNHYFNYSEEGGQNNNPSYKKLKNNRFFWDKQGFVFIGNDVRIHQNALITQGVKIGDGVIVYPYSVVTTDIPPYAIVAGNPATIIGYRFDRETIKNLLNSKWYNKDITILDKSKTLTDISYLIDKINNIKTYNDFKCSLVNSYTGKITNKYSNTLVIGPSHISIWQDKINIKERNDPNFLLFGVNGLSLYSKKCKELINWQINENNGSIVLLVPDFRIGNIKNTLQTTELDPLFISEESISKESDEKIYSKAIQILDEITSKHKDRIKLIFWCLIGREEINKRNNRYIDKNNEYKHPTWNYKNIKERYMNNILHIDGIEQEIAKYTLDNGTIHPNQQGYDILESSINSLIDSEQLEGNE